MFNELGDQNAPVADFEHFSRRGHDSARGENLDVFDVELGNAAAVFSRAANVFGFLLFSLKVAVLDAALLRGVTIIRVVSRSHRVVSQNGSSPRSRARFLGEIRFRIGLLR